MLRTVFFVVVLFLAVVSSLCARTWSVPSAECPTIQAGIDSASVGDTVLVAAGTYTGEGNKNLDFGGADLVLLSEAGPEVTIIDCEGSGRGFYFHSGETAAAVVEGFTITNGNVAGDGGGTLCDASSPTVSSCIFSGNSADWNGGGMFCLDSSPTVSICTFTENSAVGGGGMSCLDSSPTVSNCTFSGNIAKWWDGGGMFCWNYSYPTVTNCTLSGNSAVDLGGGMCCGFFSSATVSDCTFSGNLAFNGGGMFIGYSSWASVENTIIVSSPVGEAVRCSAASYAFLTCCDVYGNAGGDYVGCIAGQEGGNGNFSACPSFCNVAGGDFHLCDESPCAPGNHPDGYDCGLIGAWPVGCSCGPSRTEGTTWGAIKAMYR